MCMCISLPVRRYLRLGLCAVLWFNSALVGFQVKYGGHFKLHLGSLPEVRWEQRKTKIQTSSMR
jgi:hypothetical protein